MKIIVAIPCYNNGSTVCDVANECRKLHGEVVVIDDGSTDRRIAPEEIPGVTLLRHERNRGKGAAILSALKFAAERGADYLVTLDADGQHFASDLPEFFRRLDREGLLLVGCRDFSGPDVLGKSKFGRKFANFWLKIETGAECGDCQSGFRAYPVAMAKNLRFLSRRYNFETEILTRLIWKGAHLEDVPVRCFYPKPEARISHFRPVLDNVRISLIHTHLIGVRLLPCGSWKLPGGAEGGEKLSIFRPVRLFRALLRENATPEGLAAAAFVGTFLAVLPLVGFHTAAIVYAALRLHLNKVMAVAIQNLFMPPLTPFLCIELGYFLRHGRFWTELTFDTVVAEMPLRLWEWLLGSLVLAPFFAILMAGFTFFTVKLLRRNL